MSENTVFEDLKFYELYRELQLGNHHYQRR